jgi:hypothetical protein
VFTIHHQQRPASTGARSPTPRATGLPSRWWGAVRRRLQAGLAGEFGVRLRGERGDVPGWVLVTAMTVALVMMVWGVASSALQDILSRFLDGLRFGS